MTLTLCLVFFTALPPLPSSPKKPVVDTYHGVKVTDDYRWLEFADRAEVGAWSDAQNARARAYLDGLPSRPALEKRVTELLTFQAPSWAGFEERKGTLFATKRAPPKAQPLLVVLRSLDSAEGERVLLDVNALDPSGQTSIDFWEPSLDGRYVAVALSRKGTERGDVHVYETATGKELTAEVIPAVNSGTAGGSLAWFQGGFYYTRHPLEGERPQEDLGFYQQVYRHTLGTPPKSDTYELGREFLRIAENFLSTSPDGAWAADLVQKGDGGEFELFLRGKTGEWAKVAPYEEKIVAVRFGRDGALYLLSRKGAPKGQVLRLPLTGPISLANAAVVVPEGEAAIEEVVPTKSRLYLVEQLGGPSRVRMTSLEGKALGELPAPPVTSLSRVTSVGDGDDVVLYVSGYLTPTTPSRYSALTASLTPTALGQKTPANLSPYEVVRETCVSKDGTKVPLNIVRAKGQPLDGAGRMLLTGYGGFSVALVPYFGRDLPVWLENGGSYAVANVRGGAEFGDDWHRQGMLVNKQNVFDDFLACAKLLIDKKYTSAKRLAIEGGSNGGLLMGAALTQAPATFGAVVAHVGYFDMLRYETAPNGAFNTTEYGSVKDTAEFKALHAYSPYHRVKKGTQYPPLLFLTGKNDPRVDPFHSRKMVARLQASGTKQPVLLRTSDTGHGGGTPLQERISQSVDKYSFIFDALGGIPPKE